MSDGATCVFGQLAAHDLEEWFGPLTDRTYEYGYTEAICYVTDQGMIGDDGEGGYDWATEHGFYTTITSGPHPRVSYGLLRECWIRAICERLVPFSL
jgi:hypothetical protein